MNNMNLPINATPYRHQIDAYNFACLKFGLSDGIIRSHGVALLMEMGTGKTITSIAIAGALYNAGKIRRVLVVAPLSVLGTWENEIQKFAAFPYTITVLKGSTAKKAEQLSVVGEGVNFVIVNYESCWRLETELLKYNADLIIADEAHKMKENRSAQSKGMHSLGDHARYRLLLTGTLVTNRELDVFSQYRFLNPDIFGRSFYAFRNTFFIMGGYGQHIPYFRHDKTDEFLRKMHSIAYRVTKAEALDLPPITEEVRTLELEPKAYRLYKDVEKESFAELANSEITAANMLTRLLRLSQITGGHVTDDDGKVNLVSKAKLDALEDIIDATMAEGKKLVIMARFVPELDDIQALLERKKIAYSTVRGGIKDRAGEIDRFQSDPECKVFVGQIAAAGLGITLTAASTMVFYSLDYSMSNLEQAKARIHRVSQHNSCHYIYLVCKGTVDRKVLRALRNKLDLARTLIDDYRKGCNPFND